MGTPGPPSRPGASLFELLRSLALPMNDYAVFGSGPLLIRGIIETAGDLDVLCRGAAWARAQELGPAVAVPEGEVAVVSLCCGAVTLGTKWGIGHFDVDHLIDTAEVIDGIPFVRLEHVIAYKRLAGRPKDLEHLRLLEEYTAGRI